MRWNELEFSVRLTIGALFAALILASVIVRVLRLLKPQADWTEIIVRIRTWWIMVGVFVFAIISNRTISIMFFAFVSFLALKEYLSLIPTRRADRRVLFWAYLAIPFQFYWVYTEWYGMFIIFIPVYMFLLLPMRMISIGQTDGFIRAVGTLHWGLMTMVFSISHAAFLLVLRLKDNPLEFPGPGFVLMLVVFTELNDIFQFIWGKSFGRHKILPTVSPNKTWEGFLGGVGTTVALCTVAGPFLTPMNYGQSAVAGLVLGVGGFVGDVCISAMKRDLQIKDTGTLLPGHGGMLDRIDSLTYTAPLFFHYVYWLFLFHTHGAK
jgi:phosphatidate cytidylyltransferase